MKLRDVFRLRTALAFVAGGIGTLFFSILLETFLFRPLVKARPELFPWNRELNALALILAAIISGVVAVRLARSFSLWTLTKDEEQQPTILVISAAAGTAVGLWLLRNIVADNPLTVGWRGIVMCSAATAAGGSLLAGGRARWLAWGALIATLVVGFTTVDYDYYAYPVAIRSERNLLQGEVLVPGRDADATYPGALLVHDQGQQDRDATWGVNKPFREMAEHLVLNGYVVLRYDKRGTGASSGVFTQYGLQDFALDVVSAGEALAKQRTIGGQPIYVVGHGYGGQAATIAAGGQPDLFSGLVLLATPASPAPDLLRNQHEYSMAAMGATPEAIGESLAAVDDWIEGVLNRRYLNYGDYFGSRGISEELQAEQLVTPLPPAWVRQATDHDQRSALAALPLPVLVIGAEADWRVPPAEARALADALQEGGRSDWELIQIPGVNHQLVVVEDLEAGFQLEQALDYVQHRHPVAPAVLDGLAQWLDRLTITLTASETTP